MNYTYFIEHKETNMWWFPITEAKAFGGGSYEDYIKEFEDNNMFRFQMKHICDPNPQPISPMYSYNFNDGWTLDPNHDEIGYTTKESAEKVMRIFKLSKDEFEVTEHEFV